MIGKLSRRDAQHMNSLCGAEDARVFAFVRIRCTASITSLCWARKALPKSVVHWMSSASRLTTSGNAAMAWMLGSQFCFCTASARAVPFKLLFFSNHC